MFIKLIFLAFFIYFARKFWRFYHFIKFAQQQIKEQAKEQSRTSYAQKSKPDDIIEADYKVLRD